VYRPSPCSPHAGAGWPRRDHRRHQRGL